LDDADASIRSGNAQSEEDDAARDDSTLSQANGDLNGHANGSIFGEIPFGPVVSEAAGSKRTIPLPYGPLEQPPKRRRKSVRFSTTVESTTFLGRDPPSPGRSAVAKSNGTATAKAAVSAPREAGLILEDASAAMQDQVDEVPVPATSSEPDVPPIAPADIENKEHLQLSAEEAFFLSYGIGALSILDPETKKAVPREQLLALFRSHSYFPPREDLGPNDPFLVHYAVYHHFRSLGWVPRHGIKFGVDWMLYTRGPVFDHAEFGLIVLPAYSDAWWKENGVEAPRKSWHWLHGVNRVLSHVLKSLVLVYVDVPPPHVFDAAMAAGGISATLKEYKVREFMVRRWSSNRNR
jgi:tRNA-splicing endonuclease subunit Sen2